MASPMTFHSRKVDHMTELMDYINSTRPEFKAVCLRHAAEYERAMPTHPGDQQGRNGLAIHTLQVIKMALELNQEFDEQEIIETCLAHDLKRWRQLPLRNHQRLAVEATRGLPWKLWRKATDKYRFVALILIADMWSAYVNVKGE